MAHYRKNPVVIEAIQLIAKEPVGPLSFSENPGWLEDAFDSGYLRRVSIDTVDGKLWDFVEVQTLEGPMTVGPDWWIIKGIEGELYPCKPSVFRETYTRVYPEDEEPHQKLRDIWKDFAAYLDLTIADGRAKSLMFADLETASMWAHKALAETEGAQ